MHELSIAMSIIDAAGEEAARRGARQVNAVHLKLGPLSGVVKDALLFSYDIACADTSLAGSQLLIEEVPVLAYCSGCRAEQTIESVQLLICPECGAPVSDVTQGKELLITALEIEQ
jgi:hydrogenase nickel incorporation protein HypA/HybF